MIQVKVDRLRAAMKAIDEVVEKRSTVPILSNVLIRSTLGQMTLIGTDMDIMVEKVVDLEDAGANKAMEFTVDAATLKLIAAKLSADGVATIEADGNTGITIKCGRARFKLPTLPSDDFPVLAAGDWDAQWEVSATMLIDMIESVRFAQSTEETRYYLNGIYLHVPGDSECQFAVATDGSRLARFHVEVPDGADDMPGIIIGRKAVKALADLLDAEGGTVDVAVSTSKWRMEIGTTVLTGKAIDGQFPDYTRVIPAANDKAAWIYPGPLAEAVERVLTISSDKSRAIALEFSRDLLVLTVSSPENGTAREEVECEYDSAPLRIGFNGRFLLDMLGRLKGTDAKEARAQVKMADEAAPTLWQQSDDARQLYVLMPMRV
ncbi:DNA polymerase III subunit beta [Sphingobium yanoikuyae]|uniref:Beta sliding clamp n=1 Tax=Sphingobium yanoikuyae TaxID=13690 RepID=A0AA42WTD2_SPHYA|nr:DNA polymerase III subunit beta [Sphingobium yanoikuyae]MDH2129877.1 DNA polymerase III subunit beta [Sphingobium yanoikuyae]MDH2147871.1 DNA polymerase III subunit beta [Sphingobium yanoikuyae]MDH2165140.1 DNA polymerase III subunit beta [Sphingobium yanoikuyae]